MSVNKVILVGRLGKDPETRFTSGGQAVCNFTMATDETFKDRNGERQKRRAHPIAPVGRSEDQHQAHFDRYRRQRDAHADLARGIDGGGGARVGRRVGGRIVRRIERRWRRI